MSAVPAPLRVAFVVGQFPCLSETFILTQLVALQRRGVDVHVFAWTRPEQPVEHELLREIDLEHGVTWWATAPRAPLRRIANAARDAITMAVRSPPTLLRSLDVVRHGKHALSGNLVAWAAQFRARGPFHVCHAHFGPQGLHAARVLDAAQPRVPLVVSFYGFDLTATLMRDEPRVYDRLFRRRALLLPLSNHFRARLLQLGAAADHVHVHHLGVERQRFPAVVRAPGRGRVVRVLSVGRFVEKKGFDLALRALARARASGAAIEYTLAGDGDLRPQLERLAAANGLAGSVRFLGALAQEQVSRVMRESDVLLAPSLTAPNGDEEGTPTVVLEAMATGMPVIGSRHAGIPEMLVDGVNGALVPEGDEAALAAALLAFARAPDRWPEMGLAGRAMVEREFDADQQAERLLAHYRELLPRTR